MSWLDSLGNLKFTTPVKAYAGMGRKVPLLDTAIRAGAGYGAGKFGTRLLAKYLIPRMTSGMSEDEVSEFLDTPEMSWLSEGAGILGGGLGTLSGLAAHGDISNIAESMITPDYWAKHPERARLLASERMKTKNKTPVDAATLTSLYKAAADLDDPFVSKRIPVSYTVDLIKQDPFLNPPEKGAAGFIVEGAAPSGSGLVSGRDIMRSAVHAGAGYVGAYLFGKAIGSIVGLPPDTVEDISKKGGIAGAVLNTGVLEKIF